MHASHTADPPRNPPRRNKKFVVLRLAKFNALMAERGLTSNLAVAQFLGCGEGTISRLRNGVHNPGQAFIACVATALPDLPLGEVFDFGGHDVEEVRS